MPSLMDDFLGGISFAILWKILCQIFFLKIKNLQKSTEFSTILKGA
jgi:hypothetical protein